jgi:hypothetical protein
VIITVGKKGDFHERLTTINPRVKPKQVVGVIEGKTPKLVSPINPLELEFKTDRSTSIPRDNWSECLMIERRTRDYLLNKQIIQASSRQRK